MSSRFRVGEGLPSRTQIARRARLREFGLCHVSRVEASLNRLKEAARDYDVNLIPVILESVKLYATLGEMCHALREVFGEYESYGAMP